jgi:hypothetical protein
MLGSSVKGLKTVKQGLLKMHYMCIQMVRVLNYTCSLTNEDECAVQRHMRITFLVQVDIETNCCFPIGELVCHICIVMLIMDEGFEGAYFMLQSFCVVCHLYVRLGRICIGVMVVWHCIFFYVIILMAVKLSHYTWWKYVWGICSQGTR